MSEHPFALVPFPDSNIPEISITGRIARKQNILALQYSLAGNAEAIRFPEKASQPARKNDLWRTTCFEFFLALPAEPHYWEFNLSPSGDWNVYHMDSYRRTGFREEDLIRQLQFMSRFAADCFSVDTLVDLGPIIDSAMQIQAGITSVIQTKDGHETYWALAHPHPQADFHLRESFTLVLEGSSPPG